MTVFIDGVLYEPQNPPATFEFSVAMSLMFDGCVVRCVDWEPDTYIGMGEDRTDPDRELKPPRTLKLYEVVVVESTGERKLRTVSEFSMPLADAVAKMWETWPKEPYG